MTILHRSSKRKFHKFDNFHYSKTKAPCFEGFYFKGYSNENIFIIICGYTKSKNNTVAFLQATIPGEKVNYYEYPLDQLITTKKLFTFKIGRNSFSKNGIIINEDGCNINIRFNDFDSWPRTVLSPSIMGSLSHVPKVECKHDVISPHLSMEGNVQINATQLEINRGIGYIDKNWGRSFPKRYFWGHLNGFSDPSISLQFAKGVPSWGPLRIPVHIGFLRINDELHVFRSWKKEKMTMINVGHFEILIENKNWKIRIELKIGHSLKLRAPIEGELIDNIVEYAGGEAFVQISKKNEKKNEVLILAEKIHGTTFEQRF